MSSISKIDVSIYYLLLLYSLASSISIAGSNIAISLASLLAIVRYIKKPVRVKLDNGLVRAIGLFLMAVLLSAIFAYKPVEGLERLLTYIYRMFPLLLAILFIKNNEQIVKVLMVMSFSVLVADCNAIWQGIHGNYRATGFSSHPMVLAGFLIQMLPLLYVVGLEAKFTSKSINLYLICVAIISGIALVYNGTRGAWVAGALVFLLYGIFHIRRNMKIVIEMLTICLIVSAVVMVVPAVKDRVYSIVDHDNQSNSERILLWRSSWKMFVDHPLVGVGPGNFSKVYNPHYILPEAKEPDLGHAHNNFIHILAEMGCVGLGSFVYMFGYILLRMYRRYMLNHKDVFALATFIVTMSLLTQGLTEFNFGDSAVIRMYWFILGLSYAIESAGGEVCNNIT